ncbi:MAG TPA: hypothetical protein VHX64_06635, partial [Caulobacteraceae bacterium]|nr:hypothetical protein [Caulobacteraceae bacterium]
MRPIKGCLLAHVAALLALICAVGAAAQTTTSPPPPPAPTGDIRGDLQLFRRQIVEADVSYSPAGRAEARARLRQLEGRLDHLDALQVEIELCRITALANNAHSACLRPFRAAAVGLGFYPLEGGLYVFSAPAADGDLVGGRLLA